jgi:hypothetical protein
VPLRYAVFVVIQRMLRSRPKTFIAAFLKLQPVARVLLPYAIDKAALPCD